MINLSKNNNFNHFYVNIIEIRLKYSFIVKIANCRINFPFLSFHFQTAVTWQKLYPKQKIPKAFKKLKFVFFYIFSLTIFYLNSFKLKKYKNTHFFRKNDKKLHFTYQISFIKICYDFFCPVYATLKQILRFVKK